MLVAKWCTRLLANSIFPYCSRETKRLSQFYYPRELMYFVDYVRKSNCDLKQSATLQDVEENLRTYSNDTVVRARSDIAAIRRINTDVEFVNNFLRICPAWLKQDHAITESIRNCAERVDLSHSKCAKMIIDSCPKNKSDTLSLLRSLFSFVFVSDATYLIVDSRSDKCQKIWQYLGTTAAEHFALHYSTALSKPELVELLLYFNVLRTLSSTVSHRLENEIFKRISEFSFTDAALACLTFHKAGRSIRSAALVQRLAELIVDSLDTGEINSYALCAMLKGMTTSHGKDRDEDVNALATATWLSSFLKHWIAHHRRRKGSTTLEPWMRLAHMCESVHVYNRDFAVALEEEILASSETRIKSIARCLFAFAMLNHDPVHDIYERCLERLRAFSTRELLQPKHGEHLVTALMSLALRDIYPLDLFDVQFSRLGIENMLKRSPTFGLRDFYCLAWSVSIERPEYRLPSGCEEYYRRAAQHMIWENAENEHTRVHSALQAQIRAADQVQFHLHRFVGPQFIYFGQLLPHFYAVDICVTRKAGAFVEPTVCLPDPRAFPLPVDSLKPQLDESRHALLLVNTRQMYTRQGGRPLGHLVARKRQLQRLGYRVVELSLYDWLHSKRRTDFLNNILHLALDNNSNSTFHRMHSAEHCRNY